MPSSFPRPERRVRSGFLVHHDEDQVLDSDGFKAIVEDHVPYLVEVYSGPFYHQHSDNHVIGFQAFVYTEDRRKVWASSARRDSNDAHVRARAVVEHHRWLAERRMAGMADPDLQIAYGVGERNRQRKA